MNGTIPAALFMTAAGKHSPAQQHGDRAVNQDASIRVFAITGQRILAWGLERLVAGGAPRTAWAGTAADIDEAKIRLAAAPADVVLLDLEHCRDRGIGIPDLVATHARVLVMTREDDQPAQDQAILDGACGVLDRLASPEMFLEAIAKVHQGQFWLDRAATGRIFVEFSRQSHAAVGDRNHDGSAALTAREKKIVACIFENTGDSAKRLAEKLNISESTLRNHLTSIYGKLGVSNRFELIASALKGHRPPPFA